MQDSLEEYLKLAKNGSQGVLDKISKEMVVTAQLKKECDAKAMKIVEFSIEGKLRPEVFTRCLPFINQSHYQDIVEERAITKLCGYSICGKRIPDMPKKQYFISTKSNKVYDITYRKNYCSNFCYRASLHVKKQIENTPLWLRKLEDIPEYTLLHSSEGGLPGEYVDQGILKPAREVSFTPINAFAESSLGDIMEQGAHAEKSRNNKNKSFKKSSRLKSTMQTIKENEIEEEMQVSSNETNKTTTKRSEEKRSHKVVKKDSHHKMSCVVSLPSIEENEEKVLERLQIAKENDPSGKSNLEIKENIQENSQGFKNERTEPIKIEIEEPIKEQYKINNENSNIKTENSETNKGPIENKLKEITIKTEEKSIKKEPPEKPYNDNIDKSPTNKNKKQTKDKKKSKTVDIESIIRKALDEWLTIETCIFIHGEPTVKQILDEKKLGDYFDQLKVAELQLEQQLKYMEICRRLQLQEIAEEKFDNVITGNSKLKPLPDYKQLKADTKDMSLKVKSFYEGTMYEQADTNFPTRIPKTENDEGNPDEGPPAVFPPVDFNSQKLLRRKIFLNSLHKAIQQLLQSLGMTYFSAVLSDIQALVKTFNLSADNITFKPIMWSYIALVLLNLLSLKDESIKEILEERRSQECVKILFETLPNKRNFVEDVLSNIKNIETFVESYITKDSSAV